MNHTAILSRAFQITRRYRALWVLGILLGLAGGGGGGGGMGFNGSGTPSTDGDSAMRNLPAALQAFAAQLQAEAQAIDWEALRAAAIPLILGVLCLILILVVVLTVVAFVARVGLIEMVDRIEVTGECPSWREGLRLGWSGRTGRLFLLELVVGFTLLFVFLSLVVVGIVVAALVFGGAAAADAAPPVFIGLGIALLCTIVPIIIVIAVVYSTLRELWSREIVLGNRDIGAAFMGSVRLLRSRFSDVVLMAILMFLAGLVFAAIFIPGLILSLLVAGGIGAAVGYGVYAVAGSAIGAVIVGAAIFIVCVALPVAFLSGLYQVFCSAVWTLAWRAISPDAASPLAVDGPESDGTGSGGVGSEGLWSSGTSSSEPESSDAGAGEAWAAVPPWSPGEPASGPLSSDAGTDAPWSPGEPASAIEPASEIEPGDAAPPDHSPYWPPAASPAEDDGTPGDQPKA